MKFLTQFLCLFLLYDSAISQRGGRQAFLGSRCGTPDGYVGACVILPNCPSLLQLYANNGGSREVVVYLKQSQRSCGNRVIRREPVICCSQPVNNNQQSVRPNDPSFTVNPSNPFLNGQTGPQPQPTPTPQTEAPTTTTFTPPPTPAPTQALEQRIGECTGPDARTGTCRSLIDCPELLSRLQANPEDASFANFLRLSNQLCNAAAPIICCPSASRTPVNEPLIPQIAPTIKPLVTVEARLLSPDEGCGQSSVAHRKIVGGTPSQKGSWPWLALLGYEGVDGITFRCGGSLVTKRHVVTAAHCIRSDLRVVRLGEHDLDIDTETRHVDVNIVRMTRHPQYNSRNGHSDIAVLYLANDVQFTDTIGPVCVPDKVSFESRSLIGYTPFVAGWGRTKEGGESANILQEVQLPILANNQCKERYRTQNRLISEDQFDEATICAGVLSGGKDTCQGDSGGPLMLPEKSSRNTFYYNLIGIVSYGIGCARAGIPGVYASVPHFSDWIKEKIAEPI